MQTTQSGSGLFTKEDTYLFNEGTNYRIYQKMGAHVLRTKSGTGTNFAVWAPDAQYVSVIGDFNHWNRGDHPMRVNFDSGVWELFIPDVGHGTIYKYHISSKHNNYQVDKADPVGFFTECPPNTASIVWDHQYQWQDSAWMKKRKQHNSLQAPMSIYELHMGSWKRIPEDDNRSLSFREMAEALCTYLSENGFTHVELMPVLAYPYYPSWGYQITGFFSPTPRYGTPEDLKYLIDKLHEADIGVILDWVPSHFPGDEHGIAYFDGTHLYEHADPRQGYHPDWGSYIFNYGRNEVKSFLISSALFWLDVYHIDALRVDAVASMLYLDYSRKEGEWIPNRYGGRENLEAVDFLRQFNKAVYQFYPDVQTIAEESTAWPLVSRPSEDGGLGFGLKWDMGWMHDTLEYMSMDPIYRKDHQNKITFRSMYSFSENFVMSLSHDEVVHGKGSLLRKMPGDLWQKFANLRLLYAYMFAQPGKKLLFMGGELAQWNEWYHYAGLDWHLLDDPLHKGILETVKDLNHLYQSQKALYVHDCEPGGFEWIDCEDRAQSVLIFLRKGDTQEDTVLVALNFTPVVRHGYRMGVPDAGFYKELFNSDAAVYGGSGVGNMGGVQSEPVFAHNRQNSICLTLPPLAALFLKLDKSHT